MELVSILAALFLSLTGLVSFIHVNLILEFTKHIPLADVGLFAVALTFARIPFEILSFATLGAFNDLTAVSKTNSHVQNFNVLLKQSLLAVIFAILLFPASTYVLPLIFSELKQYAIAITALLFAIVSVKYFKKNATESLTVILLASACGVLTLNSLSTTGLFPLLTGLYAVPAILLITKNAAQVKQSHGEFDARISLAGALAALFSSLLPAVGPAVIAIITSGLFSIETLAFQSLVFSIYASRIVFDVTNVYAIQKARSAAATFLPSNIPYEQIFFYILIAFTCLVLAALVAKLINKKLNHVKINFENTNAKLAVLMFIVIAVVFQTSSIGLLILITSSVIGLYASKCDNRLLLGASLIAPVLAAVF